MATKKKQSAPALKLQKIADNFRIRITDEGNNIAQANIKAVYECKTKAEMIALCMTATKNTLIIMLRNNSEFYIKEIAPTIESSWNYSKWKHDRLAEEYARCAWRAKTLQELDAYLKAAEEREEYAQKETTTADHEPDTRTESSKPRIIRVMLSNPNPDKSPDTAPAQTTPEPQPEQPQEAPSAERLNLIAEKMFKDNATIPENIEYSRTIVSDKYSFESGIELADSMITGKISLPETKAKSYNLNFSGLVGMRVRLGGFCDQEKMFDPYAEEFCEPEFRKWINDAIDYYEERPSAIERLRLTETTPEPEQEQPAEKVNFTIIPAQEAIILREAEHSPAMDISPEDRIHALYIPPEKATTIWATDAGYFTLNYKIGRTPKTLNYTIRVIPQPYPEDSKYAKLAGKYIILFYDNDSSSSRPIGSYCPAVDLFQFSDANTQQFHVQAKNTQTAYSSFTRHPQKIGYA